MKFNSDDPILPTHGRLSSDADDKYNKPIPLRSSTIKLISIFTFLICLLLCVWVYHNRQHIEPLRDPFQEFTSNDLGGASDYLHENDTMIFFIHVPKTGGQTLSLYLRQCFTPRVIKRRVGLNHTRLRGHAVRPTRKLSLRRDLARQDHHDKKMFMHNTRETSIGRRIPHRNANMSRSNSTLSKGRAQKNSRLDLNFAQIPSLVSRVMSKDFMQTTYGKFKFAVGHCDTTVEDMLSSRNLTFITILRHPIHRVKSLYYYLATNLFQRGHTRDALIQYIDSMNGVPWSATDVPHPPNRNYTSPHDADYVKNSTNAALTPVPGLIARDEHAESEREQAAAVLATPEGQLGPRHMWKATSGWWRDVALVSLHWHGNTSLSGFVAAMKDAGMDNYMTKALSGNLPFSWRSAPLMKGAEMLRVAKKRLREMYFFGLTEYYSETMALFLETFEFHNATMCEGEKRRNVTPRDFRSRTQTTADALILETDYLDKQLYEYGLRLFQFRCAHSESCTARAKERFEKEPKKALRWWFKHPNLGKTKKKAAQLSE